MAIIYKGSSVPPLSHSTMDSNFDYINNTKTPITSSNGAAIIPVAAGISEGDPQNFFYNSSTNMFGYYLTVGGNRIYTNIPQRGATGPTGALIGPEGFIGTSGAAGCQGATGPLGAQGTNGLAGGVGATGSQGAQGSKGSKGATGPQGKSGAVGSTGSVGPVGPTGAYTTVPSADYLRNTANNAYGMAYSESNSFTPGVTSAGGVAISTTPNLFINSLSGTAPLMLDRTSNGYNIIMTRSNGSISNQTEFTMLLSSVGPTLTMDSGTTKTVVYGSTSDYRSKKNIVEVLSGELKNINKINIYSYNKKTDLENNTIKLEYGVLAHELSEIYPEVVDGKKDAINEKNEPIYQSVDYVALIPQITLALKELTSEIEELESEINTLYD